MMWLRAQVGAAEGMESGSDHLGADVMQQKSLRALQGSAIFEAIAIATRIQVLKMST
jgi:hypothetical protein